MNKQLNTSIFSSYLMIISAGFLSGLVVFGGKVFENLGLSVYEMSVIPYFLVLPVLVPFLIQRPELRITRKILPFGIIYGAICTILVFSQFGAVVMGVPVATVALLLYTQPIWTMLICWLFLKEEVTKKHLIAGIIVLLGVVVLVNPFAISFKSNALGVLVALLGGLFLSGWIVYGSYASKNNIHIITTKFLETFFMLIFMALAYPFVKILIPSASFSHFSLSFPAGTWLFIIFFSIFAQLLNHLLYFKGVEKISTADAGIIMLLEPVSAAILAGIFLHQSITIYTLIGGLLILSANYIVIKN